MKNLSISGKFSIVVLVFIATVIAVFALGMYNMGRIKDSSDRTSQILATRRYATSKIFAAVESAMDNQKDLILNKDAAKAKAIREDYDEDIASAKATIAKLKALSDATIKTDLDEAVDHFEAWHEAAIKVNELASANQDEEAYAMMRNSSEPLSKAMEVNLLNLAKTVDTAMTQALLDNERTFEESRNLGILLSIGGLIFGTGLALLIIRGINHSINQMVDTLNDTAQQVASASSQVSSSSQTLAETATEQASSLEETSSAVEEMNSMVARNAQAAKDSTEIAKRGVESANRGQHVVQSMLLSMAEINQANREVVRQSDESNQRIAEIVQVINEIGNKTKIINEIVFQTKLLSFNASVEAARAGEHGKGFAVVAEEVGNLAQMSGNAAKDIRALLDGSVERVQAIVSDSKMKIEKLIGENNKKVESGTRIAGECRDVLNEIVEGISSVSQMVQSIAGASDEQARGIDEINRAIIQLDQVTQSNAATSEEAASASEQLSAQAEQMKGSVDGLLRIVRGQNAVLATAAREPVSSAPKAVRAPRPQAAAAPARAKQAAHVIHLGRGAKAPSYASESPAARTAMGSDIVPSEDDPRFKDI